MKVGNDDEGRSSKENSDEEMAVQSGEHVEPTAVAGGESDRNREDQRVDEEGQEPERPTARGRMVAPEEATFTMKGLVSSV